MSYVFDNSILRKAVPIIRQNGHFDMLEQEVLAIQKHFAEIKGDLSVGDDEKSNIVGHYGLGGEFGNGIGPAMKSYLREFAPALASGTSDDFIKNNASAINLAFNHFAAAFYNRDSQRSRFINDEGTNEEKAGPALERSIRNLRHWVASAYNKAEELPSDRRAFVEQRLDQMTASIEKCEASFQELESLAQATSIHAVAHNQQVRTLERDEMKYVRQAIKFLHS